ncbi:MAG: CUB domain-containing protein, partial [Bacteroidia bacterium]
GANTRNYGSRKAEDKIEFVTIHTIQGSYASCISWFRNPAARVSAHYVVRALDGQVTQMVCEGDKAYHVRTHNANAIGIEHEGFIDEGYSWYTSAMYESSAALVRDICKRRGINPLQMFQGPATKGVRVLGDNCTKIKGHQHFKGNDHIDPGPYWDWNRYFRLINPDFPVQSFTDKKGEVYDSGGPNGEYTLQEYRGIRIQPDNASELTMEFEAFELEKPDGKTYWDYLDIWEGPDRNGKYLGRFAGTRSPGTITSQTGAIYMEFRSDCATTKSGWKASYTSKRKGEKPAAPANFTSRAVYPLGATLAWDKVKKPDFYLVYLRRRNIGSQRWLSYKTTSEQLHLTGLAADAIYQTQLSAVVKGDTSALTGIEFQTPPISKLGQQPIVMAVPFNSGRFNDAGGDAFGYGNSEAWVYSIRPENGKKVKLTFKSFALAEGDILKIFDGPGTSSELIGAYEGTKSPRTITSTRAALTLQFVSTKRGTDKGWTASWTTGGAAAGGAIAVPDPVVDPVKPDPTPPTNVDINALGPLKPELYYPASPPQVSPLLEKVYRDDFSFGYNMRGRGTQVPFYSLLVPTSSGFRGRSGKGFFYDDFSGKKLHDDWKSREGKWKTESGRLTQRDDRNGNTAINADVLQTKWSTYLYHTVIRMSGNNPNKRAGFHFFADDNKLPNRGNGYFIWARDGSTADYLEFYKVTDDKVEMKERQAVTFKPGQSYDLKVVYNPSKGRMEAYLNNKFALAWVDPNPIQRGEYVSLRTGNAVVEFDVFEVMKRRSGSDTKVTVGKKSADVPEYSKNDKSPALKVRTIMADVRDRLYWSSASDGETIILKGDDNSTATNDPKPPTKPDKPNTTDKPNTGSTTSTGGSKPSGGTKPAGGTKPTTTNTTPPPPDNTVGTYRGGADKPVLSSIPSKGVWLRNEYSNDFIIELAKKAGISDQFFVVANEQNGEWQSNGSQGFVYDDFGKRQRDWKSYVGNWQIDKFGHMVQTDATVGNGNLYREVKQVSTTTYLYHFKTLVQSRNENARFGLHFFANDGEATNRGDSYLVWFRNKNGEADKAEIYRSTDNELVKKRTTTININPGTWIDVKVMYDPIVGKISVYLDNRLAIAWQDDRIPLKLGSYVSLRTGGSEVLFDNFHVYQRYKKRYYVGVGPDPADHLQKPTKGRVTTIERTTSDAWHKPTNSDTKLKF